MVKCLITYKNPSNTFVENLTYCKTQEVLIFYTRILNDNNEVNTAISELATSKKDIIKVRDFLNNLNLNEGN